MDDTATANYDRLIEECEVWARKGERSFWHWYGALSDADRAAVKRHMKGRTEQ